jgi:dihydroorotate dehydrogenase electron transfer subunit
MLFETGFVESQTNIGGELIRCRIRAPKIASQAKAGNFLLLSCPSRPFPILKRPFGIHDAENDFIEILYKIKGEATSTMATLLPSDVVELIGPLGNKFPQIKDSRILLVGAGSGCAPLLLAAKEAHASGNEVDLLVSGRNAAKVPDLTSFAPYCRKISIVTRDGSIGISGAAENICQEICHRSNLQMIIACGPERLLKPIAQVAYHSKINCFISLERYMACGVGACLGCTCTTKNGNQRVCKDGPTFNAEEVFDFAE